MTILTYSVSMSLNGTLVNSIKLANVKSAMSINNKKDWYTVFIYEH